MELIGQTLGQYHIVEFIGAGGMASVYKAYQASLDRYVAVKVLPAQHALTPGYKERFILEARAVAQLSHPNILPIYDFGLEGDLSYFVMKYVPDRTLSHLMGQPMALDRVSHFLDQVAGALDHAHARGILHRDIKPANMLLEGDWLLLADFGVAKITEHGSKLTSSGHIFGTPTYVSPEQAEGSPLDQRTDIYSLGIVVYEMVVGRVPFEGTTPMRVIFKQVYEPPPPPRSLRAGLPETVEQVILKALAKKPEDRYHHAGELAKAFSQAVEKAAQRPPASSAAASSRPKRSARKRSATAPLPPEEVAANAAVAKPAPAHKKASPVESPSPAPAARPRRSMPMAGIAAVALVLLLGLAGAFVFFTGSGDANGPAPGQTPAGAFETADPAPVNPTPSPRPTGVSQRPGPTPTPAAAAPITPASGPTPAPAALPTISGLLAIPVKVGAESKVYVTGFDGAGMNGPAPVSLGNARQPMFRRDGQAIIVNGTSSGDLRGIFVTDRQGRGPAPLNDRGEAFWPVWSPDGAEIMFIDLDQGRTVFRQRSQLAATAGDLQPVQINNTKIVGNNILWSDDNRLVFQGCADWSGQFGECGIWVVAAGAPAPVRLTSAAGAPLDAKQGWLAYMLADDGDWEIYLLPLAGGQPLKLTDNNSQDGLAAIAPDGQSVAYVSNESGNWAVWTVTLQTRQKQKWFDFDPQRATIDLNTWAEERMSWTD